MKKNTWYLIIFLFTGILICYGSDYSFMNSRSINAEFTNSEDNNISKLINERKNKNNFYNAYLLSGSNKKTLAGLNEFVRKSAIFNLNTQELLRILRVKPQDIKINIDGGEIGNYELNLTRVNIAPEDLKLEEIINSGKHIIPFKHGLYYWGIINGDNKSIASLTIFDNCIMGIISNDKGNFVIGPRKDSKNLFTDNYIFYNDRDLILKNNFKCYTDDYSPLIEKGLSYRRSLNGLNVNNSPIARDSIRIYFTADYQMYLDNGSNLQQTGQFVVSAFSNTALIYKNASFNVSIPVRLTQIISVYTSTDPYINYNDSYQILNLFGSNTQDNFEGDLAQLLSSGHNQQLGGIAWINVLCQPYLYYQSEDIHFGRFSFSNIEPNFSPYPVYSWTVTVITHELGHNIASRHTHACVWPTSSGQIDSCVSVNGESCVSLTIQNYYGTIMSYCHLNGAINLSLGFGSLPGDTIKLGYDIAHCLDSALNSSERPLVYNLLQNYPNPFNPGTSIKFALPEAGFVTLKVYDVKGSEISILLNNSYYEAGIFSSYFDASHFNLSSGVYFYRLDVINNNSLIYSQIKKMVLVK